MNLIATYPLTSTYQSLPDGDCQDNPDYTADLSTYTWIKKVDETSGDLECMVTGGRLCICEDAAMNHTRGYNSLSPSYKDDGPNPDYDYFYYIENGYCDGDPENSPPITYEEVKANCAQKCFFCA